MSMYLNFKVYYLVMSMCLKLFSSYECVFKIVSSSKLILRYLNKYLY